MGFFCLLIVTLLYLGVAVDFARKLDWPHSVIYFGYAAANIGWLWYTLQPHGQ